MCIYIMSWLEDGHQGKKQPYHLACQSNVPPSSDDHPDPGVIMGEEESIEVTYPAGSQKAAGPGSAVQQAGMSRPAWVFVLLLISGSFNIHLLLFSVT